MRNTGTAILFIRHCQCIRACQDSPASLSHPLPLSHRTARQLNLRISAKPDDDALSRCSRRDYYLGHGARSLSHARAAWARGVWKFRAACPSRIYGGLSFSLLSILPLLLAAEALLASKRGAQSTLKEKSVDLHSVQPAVPPLQRCRPAWLRLSALTGETGVRAV